MGGIILPALPAASITGVGSLVVYAKQGGTNNALDSVAGQTGPFRPPQWSVGIPALTMLTIPAQYVQTNGSQPTSSGASNTTNGITGAAATVTGLQAPSQAPPNAVPQYLVFDGVMRLSHSQQMVATEHPVQNTANLSDHIRATQAIVTMDVLMTDVLPAYAAGQWVGNQSKSIACFQTLDNLRLNRIPLTVTTRLKTYYPMFIMNVVPDETVKTLYGFRGRIEFKQLNLFSLATQTVSARTQTTDSTTLGQTNPTAVPAGVTSQNGVPNAAAIQASSSTVIGAGYWDSNNVASNLFGGS